MNFTVTKKKFCLSLHYNGANSYLFVNGTKIIKFKVKYSAIVAIPLSLGNMSLVMFMILELIIIPLHLMILKTFIIL